MLRQVCWATTTRKYTYKDVAKHNTEDSAWTVIHGKVYDVTKWLVYHPGGLELLKVCTGDSCLPNQDVHPNQVRQPERMGHFCLKVSLVSNPLSFILIDMKHPEEAREILKNYYIGDLAEPTKPSRFTGGSTHHG